MIAVTVKSDGKPDRFVELSPGRRSFGSDFDCDVVLMDDDVQPVHFEIDITRSGVYLDMHAEEGGTILTGKRRTRAVNMGKRSFWNPSERLRVGGLEISLCGDECRRQPSRVARIATSAMVWSGRSLKICAVLLVSVAIVTVTAEVLLRFLAPPKDPEAAIASEIQNVTEFLAPKTVDPAASQQALFTNEQVRGELVALGFEPSAVSREGDRWFAVFHLTSEVERERLMTSIGTLPFQVSPRIYLDPMLSSASTLVLKGLGPTAGVNGTKAGKLHIWAADDGPEQREKLRGMLLSDVPGLRDVIFVEGTENQTLAELREQIGAVWAGPRPYVAMRDGTEVRVGSALSDKAKLIAIENSNRVLVDINGKLRGLILK